MTTMKTAAFAAAALAALTTSALAQSPALQRVDDRLVACLIGNAGVSLRKQIGTQVNAIAATDAAMTYAEKQCKGGRLSEGGGDYVRRSIHAMAKAWFKE
jgi:hypothetical protein